MDMVEIFYIFGIGFIYWHATGSDDFFLLMGLLKANPGRAKIMVIGVGQLIGVVGLLITANILLTLVALPPQWRHTLSGFGLILAGFLIIRSSSSKPSIKRKRLLVLTALFTYVTFASDDFLLVTSNLIPLTTDMRIVFSVGFVVGWMSSFILALIGSQIKMKWLEKILPIVLIAVGLYRLLFAWLE